jgi:hypothetical protein
MSTRNQEGRFPNVAELFESLGKKPVKATVSLNVSKLRDLLAVAEQFAGADNLKVTFEVRGKDDGVVVKATNGTQAFTGVIMPLS